MTRWLAAARLYLEPRVLAILFLGFSSGLPLALTGSTLQAWMKEQGASLTTIGGFVLLGIPYTLKFVWAPLIDAVRIPFLARILGRRRAWLVTTQALLMLSVVALGRTDPSTNLAATAALAFLVAFCSASQDIVIDAFRIESLPDAQQAAGMANYVFGYRVAMLVSAAGALEVASAFQHAGYAGTAAWSPTYAIMAGLVLVGVATVLASPEPAAAVVDSRAALGTRFVDAVVRPFFDFATRTDWIFILLFVTLFKFGDAFAGTMTVPFVLDIGFDKTDYARVGKVFGFAATLLGGFAGGYVYRTAGTVRSLWIAGALQMASNLMFVWQATVGVHLGALILTIGVENFTGGLGTVIFVAYLSGLCQNRSYTATQYALLSALSAVGRTVLSSSAGWLAEHVGWATFFLMTTAAAAPGLLLLWWLTRRGAVGEASALADGEASA
jgi:PAT family beta-lactamase induction signal transducer AmpG